MLTIITSSCNVFLSPDTGFPKEITNAVPLWIINDLKSNKMAIHEGKYPPEIDGAYLVSPYSLVKSYGRYDDYSPGYEFGDITYLFSDQSSGNQKISIRREMNNNSKDYESGEATMTHISGYKNSFSIFSTLEGELQGVRYTGIRVISGEVTSNGIKNWESSFTLTSKSSDEKEELMPVYATRIFKDSDGFSEKSGR